MKQAGFVCRRISVNFTGFFGCALPAAFARRASLRLRMTAHFLMRHSKGARQNPRRIHFAVSAVRSGNFRAMAAKMPATMSMREA